MTYVLLYVNTDKQPCYIQGSVEEIKTRALQALAS